MKALWLSAIVLAALGGSAAAQSPVVSVDNAWARASPGQVSTGAAYVTLTSHGAPDQVMGASTPVAGMAEVHETIAENGVMRMRPIPGLALRPDMPVTFRPGGYHVMLMGLKHGLVAGDSFPLTLSFAHAPPVTVNVSVQPVGATGPKQP